MSNGALLSLACGLLAAVGRCAVVLLLHGAASSIAHWTVDVLRLRPRSTRLGASTCIAMCSEIHMVQSCSSHGFHAHVPRIITRSIVQLA